LKKRRQKINIEEELRKLDKKDYKDEAEGDPSAFKKPKIVQKIRRKQALLMKRSKYSDSDKEPEKSSESENSGSEQQLDQTQKQALSKTRQEYENLKTELLSFKKEQIGSLLDE